MERVAYTDEFGDWFDSLAEAAQDAVVFAVNLLVAVGVRVPRPHSSVMGDSRYPVRELHCQFGDVALRLTYGFNPAQRSILIIGGEKTDDGHGEGLVTNAGRIWEAYLAEEDWGVE